MPKFPFLVILIQQALAWVSGSVGLWSLTGDSNHHRPIFSVEYHSVFCYSGDQQTFSTKGQVVSSSVFACHTVFVATIHLCSFCIKTSHTRYLNVQAWLWSSKPLFMDNVVELDVIFVCYTILFFIWLFFTFKHVRTILSWWGDKTKCLSDFNMHQSHIEGLLKPRWEEAITLISNTAGLCCGRGLAFLTCSHVMLMLLA